ncbi:MAG: hypothetical protein MHMPM18_000676 [Marteilia pararefringens]
MKDNELGMRLGRIYAIRKDRLLINCLTLELKVAEKYGTEPVRIKEIGTRFDCEIDLDLDNLGDNDSIEFSLPVRVLKAFSFSKCFMTIKETNIDAKKPLEAIVELEIRNKKGRTSMTNVNISNIKVSNHVYRFFLQEIKIHDSRGRDLNNFSLLISFFDQFKELINLNDFVCFGSKEISIECDSFSNIAAEFTLICQKTSKIIEKRRVELKREILRELKYHDCSEFYLIELRFITLIRMDFVIKVKEMRKISNPKTKQPYKSQIVSKYNGKSLPETVTGDIVQQNEIIQTKYKTICKLMLIGLEFVNYYHDLKLKDLDKFARYYVKKSFAWNCVDYIRSIYIFDMIMKSDSKSDSKANNIIMMLESIFFRMLLEMNHYTAFPSNNYLTFLTTLNLFDTDYNMSEKTIKSHNGPDIIYTPKIDQLSTIFQNPYILQYYRTNQMALKLYDKYCNSGLYDQEAHSFLFVEHLIIHFRQNIYKMRLTDTVQQSHVELGTFEITEDVERIDILMIQMILENNQLEHFQYILSLDNNQIVLFDEDFQNYSNVATEQVAFFDFDLGVLHIDKFILNIPGSRQNLILDFQKFGHDIFLAIIRGSPKTTFDNLHISGHFIDLERCTKTAKIIQLHQSVRSNKFMQRFTNSLENCKVFMINANKHIYNDILNKISELCAETHYNVKMRVDMRNIDLFCVNECEIDVQDRSGHSIITQRLSVNSQPFMKIFIFKCSAKFCVRVFWKKAFKKNQIGAKNFDLHKYKLTDTFEKASKRQYGSDNTRISERIPCLFGKVAPISKSVLF